MHEWIAPSPSQDLTLEEVIVRLSSHEQVAGLLLIGSTARSQLTPASDYDLALILSDMPVPLHVALTTIDGRLTDLLFVTLAQIDEVLALDTPVDQGQWLARVVRWLEAGQIAYDRTGQIARAQAKVQAQNWLRARGPMDAYGAWFRLNFNLAHTRRLLTSDDPTYRAAAELRLSLYAPSDLLFGYWEIRDLRWEGEKAAVRHLKVHDPAYLAAYLGFLREIDPEHKLAAYEALAVKTLAPLGVPWPADATALALDEAVTPERLQAGHRWWQSLFEDAGERPRGG
jgi:hypothetical protein